MKHIFRILLLSFPPLHRWWFRFRNRGQAAQYPRPLNDELAGVADVLYSASWNMSYGKSLAHDRLEEDFARYIGTRHAVAVNSGGMALQMLIRGLGFQRGDEIIHQVDTCVANPFAILNAFAIPIFGDIDPETHMLSGKTAASLITPKTRALMPIHLWGYCEGMDELRDTATSKQLMMIEDCCLALGAEYNGRMAGTLGVASAFSFGCIKPLQAGEGGMIATDDENLARELKAMRAWGDRTLEFGVRDQYHLSWNGRASELVMAVVHAQLKKYPDLLEAVRENVAWLREKMRNISEVQLKAEGSGRPSYGQVLFDIREGTVRKSSLLDALRSRKVQVRHANFELLTGLHFFKNGNWRHWHAGGQEMVMEKNYASEFPNAANRYVQGGFGVNRSHFETRSVTEQFLASLEQGLVHAKTGTPA